MFSLPVYLGPDTYGQVQTVYMVFKKTKLQSLREKEGLNRTELARLADVSARTIARMERDEGNVTIEMKNKVLKGLNILDNKLREYKYSDLFDDEED